MNENQLKGLLGLCVRARQTTFGMDGCLKVLRSGESRLVLVDAGASSATKEKYLSTCRSHDTRALLLPEGLLEEATGRSGVAVAIAPGGLADKIAAFPGLVSLGEAIEEEPTLIIESSKEDICGGANAE